MTDQKRIREMPSKLNVVAKKPKKPKPIIRKELVERPPGSKNDKNK